MTQRSVLHLREGEWAYIQSLEELDLTCRLLTLGVLPKSKVHLVRKAPFGGAYYLKINENCVAVRTEEAKHILID